MYFVEFTRIQFDRIVVLDRGFGILIAMPLISELQLVLFLCQTLSHAEQ